MGAQSLLDRLNGNGIVGKSRFVDNFDGDSLDEMWTVAHLFGGGTDAMADEENGGYRLTAGASINSRSQMSFNDIRHYSHNSSVVIGEVKQETAATYIQLFGLTEQHSTESNTRAVYDNDATKTFKVLVTTLNNSHTTTNTSIGIDLNWTGVKIKMQSASVVMSLDGVLECVATANLPDVAMQPYFWMQSKTTATKEGRIRFMEAYNT